MSESAVSYSSTADHDGELPPATYRRLANALRALAMDAVERAKSGHPGMPMGMADAATVLWARHLKFDPAAPHWPDRDRFVLSAGHGSMLLYGLLHLTGYPEMTIDQLKRFRQLGSLTPGHPEYRHTPGVETTTGPLGQGLATAVGMAIAERLMAARFGTELVDHRTYVIAGDGCLMEGISHEAISLAGHLKLGKLIVLWDDNHISIDGPTSLSVSDDQLARFAASGWDVQRVDGHDPAAVSAALDVAKSTATPSLIACRTTIAFGAPTKGGTASAHGSPLGAVEIAAAREALGWPYPPFEIPDDVARAWQQIGDRGAATHTAWQGRHDASAKAALFDRQVEGRLPAEFDPAILALKQKLASEAPALATRQASGLVLDTLAPILPELLGGSADLTPSNNTKAKSQVPVTPEDFTGTYLHYGVREHGMTAAMNGIAVHGGLIPYGGTFLVFADYARPAIRLAALMGLRIVSVMTHDSIGLGEDGPTHQPIEHLAALRAIPHLQVFRPADAVEAAECWAAALNSPKVPSVMALSRQAVPAVRLEHTAENLSARGGYVLADASGARGVTLLASGTEVSLALAARDELEGRGVPTAVVSMPCWALFDQQDAAYQEEVLGEAPRIAVEAATGFGWERYLGRQVPPGSHFVGMTGFGASAPGDALYAHFGITVEAVVDAAVKVLCDS
ncbi:MAG TPA: transketolase [Stellaceae bacterium]|nr:transketolase [Stellaceae bacterium]